MDLLTVNSYTFNPLVSRSFFKCPDKESYVLSQYSSVSIRLEFEYKKCKESNGICYFVTFTYNDKCILNICGHNFLDNFDARHFCNKSVFSKRLSSHGYSFKFAFFGESGDGKGTRGLDNNPHFHALFFLYPDSSCDLFYHDQSNFLDLCLVSWNNDPDSSSKRYVDLNVGNVSYSKEGAVVSDSKVFSYCSMYCIKSLYNSSYNDTVRSLFRKVVFVSLLHTLCSPVPSSSSLFKYVYPNVRFHVLLKHFFKSRSKIGLFQGVDRYSDYLLVFKDSLIFLFSELFSVNDLSCVSCFYSHSEIDFFSSLFFDKLFSLDLFQSFYQFVVNRHLCRYRLSSCLGINGLDYIDENFMLDVSFIDHLDKGRINLPSYYYRKFFYDRVSNGDSYVYIPNSRFNHYLSKLYSPSEFDKHVLQFEACLPAFLRSLPSDLAYSLKQIPSRSFVSFRFFRGLSFSVNDFPFIDPYYPLSYLINLDFSDRSVCSVPLSLRHFADFVGFESHPFFAYSDIVQLSYLYSDFIRRRNTLLSDTLVFSSLKDSVYETVV